MEYESNSTMKVELIVERGEPTRVGPAEETQKGRYFLSNLDQNVPLKVSSIYCFKSKEKGDEEGAAEAIRNALSKLLVHYYPFAGRLVLDSEEKLALDCTGEGAVFVEAQANCSIDEIGNDTVAMTKLVYDADEFRSIFDEAPLQAQVTKFKNGGFALGLSMNHCVLDGRSAMEFINSWGVIARGLPLKAVPFMDRTILKARNPPQIDFPHQEFSVIEDTSNTADLDNEKLLYKTFCFDPKKLEKLKAKAVEDGVLDKCTTFEALSAFLWRARAQALKLRHDQKIKLLFIVDGRQRFNPPLPENYFGNGVALTSAVADAGELTKKPLSFAVRLVQEAIKIVTDGYLRSAIDYFEVTRAHPSLSSTFLISTMSRLGFDAVDFGWGYPVLVGCAMLPVKEAALFMPHPRGERGINVLLGLPTSSMKIFQELMHI